MDDKDLYLLCGCIAGLAVVAFLHGRMIVLTADKVADVRADVDWLKDNTVATEARA